VNGVRKISGLLLLIPLLVLAIAGTPAIAPGATTLSLDPSGTVGLGPGEYFSVNVKITDVTDLGGYEFQLSYDSSLLHVTAVTVVEDWFAPAVVWKKVICSGFVSLIVTLPMGTVVGIDGSGVVATIDFTVDGEGMTPLDLHDTILADPWANPIMHQVADGAFANVALPQLWIKDKGAAGGGMYPEWHVGEPGTPQTLYARIVNTGDVGSYIRVKVTVYNYPAGKWPILTNTAWIPPKAAHNVTVTLTAEFTETYTTGVYYVSGTIEFSLDGTLYILYSAFEDIIGGRGTTRDVPGNDATKFKVQ